MTKTKRLKSKVCLVGEKAVGKTSLIRRYVIDMFDEQYLTTIGTRVTKKELRLPMLGHDLVVDLDMTIWDIMGEKGFRELLKDAYFYGTNGVLAVADLSRRRTLDDLDDWVDGGRGRGGGRDRPARGPAGGRAWPHAVAAVRSLRFRLIPFLVRCVGTPARRPQSPLPQRESARPPAGCC